MFLLLGCCDSCICVLVLSSSQKPKWRLVASSKTVPRYSGINLKNPKPQRKPKLWWEIQNLAVTVESVVGASQNGGAPTGGSELLDSSPPCVTALPRPAESGPHCTLHQNLCNVRRHWGPVTCTGAQLLGGPLLSKNNFDFHPYNCQCVLRKH